MRTTIELTDDHRARLLRLAAQRGEKGFSKLVQEAVEQYLEGQASREERVQKALSSLGSLSKESAERLEASVRKSRASLPVATASYYT